MKTLLILAMLTAPAAAFAQVDCTLPPGYAIRTCAGDSCEIYDGASAQYGAYDISNPYVTYGCAGVGSGPDYNPLYTPPDSALPLGDPFTPSTALEASAAPEIDGRGALGGLTLLAGLLCIVRGRRRVPRGSPD